MAESVRAEDASAGNRLDTMLKATSGRDLVFMTNGHVLFTHARSRCEGDACCIHNPSEHVMSDWPFHWRNDRQLMERTCPHGIGHPDPDDIAYKVRAMGERMAAAEAVHGCDGCCQSEPPPIRVQAYVDRPALPAGPASAA